MKIFYIHRAVSQFEALPKSIQRRIAEKMRFYESQKDPIKFAKRLTDYREGEFRFRIGMYRLTFDVKDNGIYILKIEKRDKAYD